MIRFRVSCLFGTFTPPLGNCKPSQQCLIGSGYFLIGNNNAKMPSSPIDVAKAISGKKNEDIAEDLGVTPGYVSRLNRRERNLTLVHIEKLAESAGVPLSDFFKKMAEAIEAEEDRPPPKTIELTSRRDDLANALNFDSSEQLNFDPEAFKQAYGHVYKIHKSMLGGLGDDDLFTKMFLEAYETIVSQKQIPAIDNT